MKKLSFAITLFASSVMAKQVKVDVREACGKIFLNEQSSPMEFSFQNSPYPMRMSITWAAYELDGKHRIGREMMDTIERAFTVRENGKPLSVNLDVIDKGIPAKITYVSGPRVLTLEDNPVQEDNKYVLMSNFVATHILVYDIERISEDDDCLKF